LHNPIGVQFSAGHNLIQLSHEKISEHHGVILQTKEGWVIEDLQSTNGIVVNNQRVSRARLNEGDTVKIGSFEFYFEINVPADDWVPSHIIVLSSNIHDKTSPGSAS
jgi:pSer/pThr/pTyr-binding forkhead associated (FHA) protein